MIRAGLAHPVCAILIVLLAAPSGFAQPPVAVPPAPTAPPTATPATSPPLPQVPPTPLTIVILEGNNAVNSIPLVSSTAAVVEVRDSNDYPIEDASVTFTLPDRGPGGVFAQGAKTFSTKSDARGQASAPVIIPTGAGKFKIVVTAIAGDRKGQTVVSQTNSEGSYTGPAMPSRPWYKKKLFWFLAGGVVVAVVVVVVLLHSSSSGSTIVVTPGAPVITP
jgi:hypothetical protein